MVNTIFNDIKTQFRHGSVLMRIILLNSAIFVLALLVKLAMIFGVQSMEKANVLFSVFVSWLAVPYPLGELIWKPWTVITYMFFHYDIWHIFWNMLFLYWFGKLLTDVTGNRKVLPVYIYGGLAGMALSIIAYYVFPGLPIGNAMLGASAAVYAIMLASATLMPDYKFHLLFIGPVSIKWIVLFRFVVDLLAISNFENMGGHIAHIGGAFMGFFYIVQYRKGRDFSLPFNRLIDTLNNLFLRYSKVKIVHRAHPNPFKTNRSQDKEQIQQKMDAILDKISKSGYESLTKEEKDFLFTTSKNI